MKEVERKKKYENYNKKKRDKDLNRQKFFFAQNRSFALEFLN